MKKPIIIKTIKHVDYEMALIVAGEIINRESMLRIGWYENRRVER